MRKPYLIILLCLLFLRIGPYLINRPAFAPGARVKLEGQLGSEPTVDRGKKLFKLNQFVVTTTLASTLHYGDRVVVEGVAGEYNRIDPVTVTLAQEYAPNVWERAARAIRTNFIEIYQSTLPREEANLLSGVVLGSVGLDRQFKAKLADVGLTHVVAASGMNITLFSGFVAWLLSAARLGKMLKAILSVGFIVFYSTVTGFEPSIVRAAIMAGVVLLASILGRQGSGFWALAVSAYLMLWVSPELLMSASFLLSFLAMTGQIFLGAFRVGLPGERSYVIAIFEEVKNSFWQSFLAIVFTLPIVLWFFAKFSLVSLLSNMLTLWTVEPLMILGGIMGIVGMVSQDLARIVALPAGPLLAFFLGVVESLSGKEYFVFNLKLSSWLFPVGYYLLLAGFVWWWLTGNRVLAEKKK